MPQYRVETHLRDGTYVQRLPFYNLQYEVGFNKPYGCRFQVPLYHKAITADTLAVALHEIWVYRDDQLVKAGPLWDAVPSSSEKSISCSAMDILDYLDVRLTHAQEFSAVDQTAIAWGLINYTQGLTDGDLNVNSGTLNTGISRSATWREYDNKYILEAISDLSEMTDGFDFNIDPDTRNFNAYYPRPQRDNSLELVYPQHIRKYAVQYMGKYMRNSVGVQGQDPSYATAVDTTSRSTYGLREYGDSYRDAQLVTDLDNYASRIRDQRKDPKEYPTITLRADLIDIFDSNIIKYGDKIHVIIEDGYVNVNATLRYITAQVSVDKQGSESVVLYLQDLRELD